MNKHEEKRWEFISAAFIVLLALTGFFLLYKKPVEVPVVPIVKVPLYLYEGKVSHVFFHSLVVYPELAFRPGPKAQGFRNYMVTQSEFNKILPALYKNNFILISAHDLYETDGAGKITRKQLFLPKDKKPLIISIDDVNYYGFEKDHGFADKLVLDREGNIATRVITPEGKIIITRDGDVMPILDDFVRDHPDFSLGGAKGLIALTGFEGILGYRTHDPLLPEYQNEIRGAERVVEQLKKTGWEFASHSYSHEHSFATGEITLEQLKSDTTLWKNEVESLVGPTDIFIGPFGQIFKVGDPRHTYLISQGFKMLDGVGADMYLHYFSDHVVMNRADIDGIRLIQTPHLLQSFFDPKEIVDPARG
jgi:hypothetical protein